MGLLLRSPYEHAQTIVWGTPEGTLLFAVLWRVCKNKPPRDGDQRQGHSKAAKKKDDRGRPFYGYRWMDFPCTTHRVLRDLEGVPCVAVRRLRTVAGGRLPPG